MSHATPRFLRLPVMLALPLFMAACSTTMSTPGQPADTSDRLADAAAAPLADFNLVQTKIPEVLLEARKSPYALPASCEQQLPQLTALNAVLGQDLDAPRGEGEDDWFGKAGDAFGDAAVSGLRSAAEGIIPFRGWVRKLTGAERHNREVTAAIAAGLARRAFLRGWGNAQHCPLPKPPAASASAAH